MQCILCEKPSAMKNYSLALGGNKGTFNGQEYELVCSVGHIFSADTDMSKQVKDVFTAEKYKKWDLDNLPWDYENIKFEKTLVSDKKEVFEKIKKVAEKADEIVIATDNDPTGEGELLAWEILEALHLKNKKYYRSYHIDESKKEIQKAMKNLKYLGTDSSNDPDYKKALFRFKWDFMSMQFTRIFTKFAGGKTVLRQGRLKSYMVWVVGEQIRKAEGYKKIPFYTCKFKDENGNIYTNENEPQFDKKEDVDISKYKASDVVVDSKSIKYSAPVALYDLSLLSSSLAPFGFTSKQVLDTYQKMYEDRNSNGEAIVSYPRTEDKAITPEQFNDFLKIADQVADLVGVDRSLLTHRTARKTHVSTNCSHGANRPTGNVPSSLGELESKYGKCGVMIYKFLARNALAMLCEDYKYEHQEGHIKDYPDFKGKVNIPLDLGYKKIFNDKDIDIDEENAKELGKKGEPFVFEGFPPKPNMPTAKWLANLLKKNDVGTGATRTSIYADITDENSRFPLLIDTKGKITMTKNGEMSYKLLKDTHIGDVKLTESLQEQMREVAKGKDPNKYLKEIEQLVLDDIETVKKNANEITILGPAEPLKDGKPYKSAVTLKFVNNCKCPKCGSKIVNGKEYYYCQERIDKKCDFIVKKDFNSAEVNETDIRKICKGEKTRLMSMYSDSKQKAYEAYLKYDKEQGNITMEFKGPELVGQCLKCGKNIYKYKGQYGEYVKCEGCGETMSAQYAGKKFTDEEIKFLLAGGTIKGKFKSKAGKTFSASIWKNGNKFEMEFDKIKTYGTKKQLKIYKY